VVAQTDDDIAWPYDVHVMLVANVVFFVVRAVCVHDVTVQACVVAKFQGIV